jgi:hypothetical protein
MADQSARADYLAKLLRQRHPELTRAQAISEATEIMRDMEREFGTEEVWDGD